tara:strand:+ start:2613 stop:2900 length:288 start_codon:yes stop_codon:yes gene_type:complete
MYVIDRPLVDGITDKTVGDLTNQDIVDIARLLSRYSNYPGSNDIRTDLVRALDFWSLTRDQLQIKSRKIWQSGWRPSSLTVDEVGSGADVQTGAA